MCGATKAASFRCNLGHWMNDSFPRTTDTQRTFFENLKLLGLGRQIGPKILRVFRVFSAKLQHPFRHCESVHGFEYLVVVFLQKTLVFMPKTYNSQMILVVNNMRNNLHRSLVGGSAIWAHTNGLASGRLACRPSKT